jgi:hypothetical protein
MSSDAKASLVSVPNVDAAVDEVLSFAATYDAYHYVASDPHSLDRVLWPIYDDIEKTSRVPHWVQLDLARALLFYAYRRDHFGGGYGPYEPMRALLERIRELSGGWVQDRRRPDDAVIGSIETGSRTVEGFEDSWEYSGDGRYRWWYERRWSSEPALCVVGLNPSTGDTDGKARPTLARVVGWARREGCGAVVVVNLFAYRATRPTDLFAAPIDIIGHRNDATIRQSSATARITLAAWGGHRRARARANDVLPLLRNPRCVGTTKSGAPRHPLYVPASKLFEPYVG